MSQGLRTWGLVFSFVVGLGMVTVPPAAAAPPEPFNVFYTIRLPPVRAQFQEPADLMLMASRKGMAIRLLDFERHNRPFPPPQQPYNRDAHFGSWVDDPRDRDCLDTRAKVLVRDSRAPVRMAANRCYVESGDWLEPYAGRRHQDSRRVQIDHVVALKNAYISGASRWTWPQRCLYGNYLGNDFHLLTTDGEENLRKSDHTPADWMPSDRRYHCRHLSNWLKVKAIWGLVLGDREARAIAGLARAAACNPVEFVYDSDELSRQRQWMAQNMSLCASLPPGGRRPMMESPPL